MRRLMISIFAVGVLSTAGCAMSDALFCIFGDHYTDGGTTRQEKKYHYEERLRSYNEDSI